MSTTNQPAALSIGRIHHARNEWSLLAPAIRLEVWEYSQGSRKEFLNNCANGKYNDVVGIYRSNESSAITGPFDEELVSSLPPAVKFICHNGAGYDNIDIDACTRRGIGISSTPGVVNKATADVAIFLLIGALRLASSPLTAIQKGQWQETLRLGHDPHNKILGILGMGGIGGEVAKRAVALGMKIQYHNRHELPEHLAGQAKYVSFDELLSQSDIISLNLSLNSSTKHIIGRGEFAKMKHGVVIVNTARGPLIDEEALVDALDSGKVFSAGLDVYENEPQVHPRLQSHGGAFLLPHIGTITVETKTEMERLTLSNLRSGITEKHLLTQVKEQLAPSSS